jgi:hypothetical protein
MEHGGQDDEYDYSQNRYLHFEHAGQYNNFIVNKMNLSVIKSDVNHCEMARSAETNHLIEKTDWGNESSMKYFFYGKSKQSCWHTVSSIKCNETS